MANSRFYQFLFSKIPALTLLQCKVIFGATGAVSSVSTNSGVQGIVRATTGLYTIRLLENYNAFIKAAYTPLSGITGSNVSDGSLVANTPYQITAVGSTDWAAVGLQTQVTAAVGNVFVASASGTAIASGGTAKALTTSGVASVEICRDEQSEVAPSVSTPGTLLLMQTLDFAGALVDPTSGSAMMLDIWMRNSSVTN